MRVFICLFAALGALSVGVANAAGAGSDAAGDLEIQHAFGGGDWTTRGALSLSIDPVKKKIALKFASNTYEFDKTEVTAFNALLDSNEFYRVRIKSSADDGAWMSASAPACSLAGNRFREAFRFHIDKTGALLGFDYIPITQNKDCETKHTSIKLLSKASASIPQDAHAVPANAVAASDETLLKKMNQPGKTSVATGKEGGEEGDEEQQEPEPSFLRKYWYIFVPLALMSMLAPAPPEEGGQAAAGAGGAPAANGGGKKRK